MVSLRRGHPSPQMLSSSSMTGPKGAVGKSRRGTAEVCRGKGLKHRSVRAAVRWEMLLAEAAGSTGEG